MYCKSLCNKSKEYVRLSIILKKGGYMPCCNENYLVWKEEGEVWPYEIWRCTKCNKEYNVELIRDFKNKEER